MCVRGPREGKKGGGEESREGGGGERRPRKGGGRKSARSSGAASQLLSLPQLSGENSRNGDEATTYLGETGSAVMGVLPVLLLRLLWAAGEGCRDYNVSHPCIHTFGGGGRFERLRPGTWRGAGAGRPLRMGTRGHATPGNS